MVENKLNKITWTAGQSWTVAVGTIMLIHFLWSIRISVCGDLANVTLCRFVHLTPPPPPPPPRHQHHHHCAFNPFGPTDAIRRHNLVLWVLHATIRRATIVSLELSMPPYGAKKIRVLFPSAAIRGEWKRPFLLAICALIVTSLWPKFTSTNRKIPNSSCWVVCPS